MHIHVDVKGIQAGIATVVKSLSSKPSIPILEGIYLNATNEGLLLRCSDMTLQIDCLIPAEVIEEGSTVLPGRFFSEISRKLDGESMEISMEGKSVAIHAGRSKMNMQCADAKEFPDMSSNKEATEIEIPQIVLKEMIRQTVFATAQDDSKPILMGVLCEIENNSINMIALDGFRLALRRAVVPGTFKKIDAVIPAKSLIEIGRTLQDKEETVKVRLTQTHMSLDMGHTKIISRLLDGDYIRYQSILPSEHKSRVRINREELVNSIERAILLAREGNNNLVRFTIKEEELNIYANSALGRMEEDIKISLNGEPIQIAFNARYFCDALKVLTEEEIYLDMNNNVSPCVIRPVQGDGFYYLILPVRIFA